MTHTLSLAKDGHRYVFRYATGHEDEVIASIVGLVEGGQTTFNWLDAATLSFQVAQATAADCCGAIYPIPTKPDES